MRIVYFTHSLASCWNHGNAHFLRGDMQKYGRESRRLREIFAELSPDVEPISLDEAFIDVTSSLRALRGTPQEIGARLKQRLQSLISAVPQIADIRGPGFMNAVEFNLPGTKTPNADFTSKVREKALAKGLILLTCGVYGNVIRFLAPITIDDKVFGEALDILEETLRECAQEA